MGYLLLVRHGESRWNMVNKFTGWIDVPLSEAGMREAETISRRIRDLRLDVAFTSHLERAHQTLLVILSKQHCTGIFIHEGEHAGMRYPFKPTEHEIPVYTTWLLNERHYGVLQGMAKDKAARRYGRGKVLAWRRSFDKRPPLGESLEDVSARVVPYFRKRILPRAMRGENVLVVAHGNTLRAVIKHIEGISDEKIAFLELKPGQPFVYRVVGGEIRRMFEGYRFTRPISWER